MQEQLSFKRAERVGAALHACNSSTREAEEQGWYMSLRPPWATQSPRSVWSTQKNHVSRQTNEQTNVQYDALLRPDVSHVAFQNPFYIYRKKND